MRQLKALLTILVLTIAACRSVPIDVRQAHDNSMEKSVKAFTIAEDVLVKIANGSVELNTDAVRNSHNEWNEQMLMLAISRDVVRQYLRDTDAGVSKSYGVASQLLVDMNRGFNDIERFWRQMISPELKPGSVKFIAAFRKDIRRFRQLEHKFDEWIKQFKVKG